MEADPHQKALPPGYAKADVIRLFAFIDWVMSLPADMEKALWTEIQKFEEETKMEYVTSVERIGMEERYGERQPESSVPSHCEAV